MFVRDAFATPWRHRHLIARLARREIAARYRGSLLGPVWAVAMPLCMVGVYAFAFATVFQSRIAPPNGRDVPFVLLLFIGLLLFQLFAEVVQASPGIVRANPAYVKQVIFPLEILPIISFVVALFNTSLTMLVLLVFHLFMIGLPSPGGLWIPLIALPLAFLAIGLGWMFAALGPFLRDMTQVAALLCTALMFLSPIFYSLESVPARLRWIIALNPLTTVVVQSRDALFAGQVPEWGPLGLCLGASLAVFVGGFWIFRSARPAFADVM